MIPIPFDNLPQAPLTDAFAATKPVVTSDRDAGQSFEDHLRPPSDDDRLNSTTRQEASNETPPDSREPNNDDTQRVSEDGATNEESAENETVVESDRDKQNNDEKEATDEAIDVAHVQEALDISSQLPTTDAAAVTTADVVVDDAASVTTGEVIVDDVALDAEQQRVEPVDVSSEVEVFTEELQVKTNTEDGKQRETNVSVEIESSTDEAERAVETSKTQPSTVSAAKPTDEQIERDAKPSAESEPNASEVVEKALIENAGTTDDADGDRRTKRNTKTDQKIEPVSHQRHAETNDSTTSNTGRLPRPLLTRGATSDGNPLQLSEADQTRFVQRVARAFEAARGQRGQIRLRLSPPELGSLQLEVRLQGGAMTAKIEADTTMARSLLMDNLPALRERLEQQGIRMERFEVDVPDRQQSGLPDSHEDRQRDETATSAKSHTSEETAVEESSRRTASRPSDAGDDQLNVLV